MTTERSGISEVLACAERLGDEYPDYEYIRKAIPFLRAYAEHLSRDAVVSDEDVEIARIAFVGGKDGKGLMLPSFACMKASLSSFAARHAAVPDGYVLVSTERVSKEMVEAGAKFVHDHEDLNAKLFYTGIFMAMLSASPKAMLAQRDGGK